MGPVNGTRQYRRTAYGMRVGLPASHHSYAHVRDTCARTRGADRAQYSDYCASVGSFARVAAVAFVHRGVKRPKSGRVRLPGALLTPATS